MDFEKDQDNEQEKNKSEKPEKVEFTPEILEEVAKEKVAEVENAYQSGKKTIKELAQQALKFIAGGDSRLDKVKTDVNVLEGKAQKLAREAEEKIESESKISAFEHLPNYDSKSPEAALVDLIPANEKVQERFDQKISPDMKEAIATVCGQVFNKGKYPYALIGSNCYVPHTKYSEKIPDDLDVVFGIKDLGIDLNDITEDKIANTEASGAPGGKELKQKYKVEKYSDGAYAELVKLQEQGLVKGLEVSKLKNLKNELNGCVKVHCFVKTAKGWKEMEAFAQNMHDEVVNQGKETNGIINLGVEAQTIETVDIDGVKANIGSEKTAEELYLKNTVNEFSLYDLNGWKNRGILNAKALQRIFNIINLDENDFEESIEKVIEKIGQLKPPTDEAREAQAAIQAIWSQFKKLPGNGNGLVDHLMEKNGVGTEGRNEKESKILNTEKAVDIMTAETSRSMRVINDQYNYLAELYLDVESTEDASKSEIEITINEIKKGIDLSLSIGRRYKEYIQEINTEDKNDFCAYAALPRLRNYFIKPTVLKLLMFQKNLEHKLSQTKS